MTTILIAAAIAAVWALAALTVWAVCAAAGEADRIHDEGSTWT